ncbi:MAG: SDR family oxidoreductase [Ignavibacteriales bacterium]|nr:MAG: SDR family oxidoreductase [Ignavibacteriales bacterium]
MKIVITGGAGFIGSHLAEYWLEREANVTIIDNLRTGYLANIPKHKNVEFIKDSITNKNLVFDVLEKADYVFNFAALVSVPESVDNPGECNEINVLGLINLLEASKKYNIRKIVHSSSAAVYGDNPELPKKTSMKPEPKTPYGITKLDGEYYCQFYHQSFGVNSVSLRYFNVFGPRQDPKSQYAAALPIFISKAIKNEDITIYGDGNQTRDFIYVKDVVMANVQAAENEKVFDVYNVANGSSISILDLARLIVKETDSKSEIIFKPERAGDIKHSLADIELTRKDLDFSPKVALLDGIRKTIDFFGREFGK